MSKYACKIHKRADILSGPNFGPGPIIPLSVDNFLKTHKRNPLHEFLIKVRNRWH